MFPLHDSCDAFRTPARTSSCVYLIPYIKLMCIVPFVRCLVRCFAKDSKISTKLMQQKSPLGFNILQRNPVLHYNIHRDRERFLTTKRYQF